MATGYMGGKRFDWDTPPGNISDLAWYKVRFCPGQYPNDFAFHYGTSYMYNCWSVLDTAGNEWKRYPRLDSYDQYKGLATDMVYNQSGVSHQRGPKVAVFNVLFKDGHVGTAQDSIVWGALQPGGRGGVNGTLRLEDYADIISAEAQQKNAATTNSSPVDPFNKTNAPYYRFGSSSNWLGNVPTVPVGWIY